MAAADSLTSQIYGLLADNEYGEVVRQMGMHLQSFPRSRAALSLLAYSHYALADYRAAAGCYEELTRYYPEVDTYRLYYAQCLGKAGLHAEATRAAARVASDALAGRGLTLQASVAYAEGDLATARALLEGCPPGDADARVNSACVLYKEGATEEARKRFEEAIAVGGWAPDLAYNVAVCHYAAKAPGAALRWVNDVIERGEQEHPELSVGTGSAASGEVRSVGNTPALRETHLVEAFNLKAAVELSERAPRAARDSLGDMPPRGEDELDPVTLHNTALVEVEANPAGAFRKLNYLLSHPPFPPEAFGNLLILYLKHDCPDQAADVLAENAHLTQRYLTPALYDFLDAALMSTHSPEEAYRRYDALAARHTDALRRHTKAIQDARLARDGEAMKECLAAYDEALDAFMPVLLGMSRLYWAHDNFVGVERVLRQAAEFAGEHDAWRLGMAHALFMQACGAGGGAGAGGAAGLEKYKECIRLYEPVVRRYLPGGEGGGAGSSSAGSGSVSILDVTAIVLANLCVAYIVTENKEEAQRVMVAVEAAEEEKLSSDAANAAAGAAPRGGGGSGGGGAGKPAPCFHLSIINLVIGTLYCAKGNTEFGVTRVLRALEPPQRKLGPDTWYYCKRALLHLGLQLAKGMVVVTDATFADVLGALDAAELHGVRIPAEVLPPSNLDAGEAPRTIASEARALKRLFLRLREQS